MRKFQPMPNGQDDRQARPTLRIDKPTAAYARRSPSYAKDEKKDKSQSREMQTEDIKKWATDQGWKEKDFYPYFSDFGLSGTLRPDLRPDLLRLFDDIDSGMFEGGSVICYQESRLFRDETQIYYNQFIDKCKQHDIVVVVISPYLMIYDFHDDFLTEMFRWKCKEAADFIKRHVKGWMHPARYRAAWHDGEWAGLGNLPAGYIVDYNEDSRTYKKLIPYQPHAEKKREYRLLFVELGCNISLLYKRLRESPIIFPDFEPWVDPRNVSKFLMAKHPQGGYFPKDKATVKGILTDPHDIGYRVINGVVRRNHQGEKIIDHDPIVDRELFDLCFYPLATTDFDGNLIGEAKPSRYFHRGNEGEFGLLKFRISSTQGEAFAHAGGEYDGDTPLEEGSYVINSLEGEFSLRHSVTHAVIPCEEIDGVVVDRLMENAQEISQNEEDIAEYQRQAKQTREKRQAKLRQVKQSIIDIEEEQKRLTASLGKKKKANGKLKPLSLRAQELILKQIDDLEEERLKLLQRQAELGEEAESDLGSLDEEIKKLAVSWPKYTFQKRRALIDYLIKTVVVDVMSTHWLKIQVSWIHEEWGSEEMYYRRYVGSRQWWTDVEEGTIRDHYADMPKDQLMALLPDRGWQAIMQRAQSLGVTRRMNLPTVGDDIIRRARKESFADLKFMETHNIPVGSTRTIWEKLN